MPEPPAFLSVDVRESYLLAPYAMHAADSAGRVYEEPSHTYRNPFQRDRDRIVHSSAFRRLAHKTQVFIGEMGDYHRTRLTHTLEVASIARTIGRTLRLNEDLIEPLALAHDIGHPPFGHAGEDVLDECLRDHGGFNHNRQALRIVELLETRYPDFPGLNLSREMLFGQQARIARKANAGRAESSAHADAGQSQVPAASPPPGPLLEVQTVDAADSIAYDAHDADDAIELGLLELPELEAAQLWRDAAGRARRRYASLQPDQFRRATVHELIDLLVSDLLTQSAAALADADFRSAAEAASADTLFIRPSAEVAQQQHELEALLFARVYRHPDVLLQRARAGEALREMFCYFARSPEALPAKFRQLAATEGPQRAAADYLACMTDRLALETHSRANWN
jgi:dGTPase